MNDYELVMLIDDPLNNGQQSNVLVMFTATSEKNVFVHSIFRVRDDLEIEFASLPLETREDIQQKCIEKINELNK